MGSVIQTGRVTGGEIKKNKDGEKNVLMLQVEITEPDDVQPVQLMKQAGEDTNPPDGSTVTILSIGEAYKIAIASDDGIEPSMDKGEKKIYSSDSGAIAAYINLLSDGIIELNGNSDFAVRYNALETAFNQLLLDFNNLVGVFNSHKQLVIPDPAQGGALTAQPVLPPYGVVSEADITPAKVDEVKII